MDHRLVTKVSKFRFEISTNSMFVYNLLRVELGEIIESNDVERKIAIYMVEEYPRTIGGEGVVYSNHTPVFVKEKDRDIMLIHSLDDKYTIRAFVLRAILDYLLKTGLFIAVHATAISTDAGDGVLFSGNKNAGKSTMSYYGILHCGYKLVSDDITLLYKEGDSLIAEGVFKGINAGAETRDYFGTGVQIKSKQIGVKERFVVDDSFYIKKAKVASVFFLSNNRSSCGVISQPSLFFKAFGLLESNIIKTFSGISLCVNKFFLQEIASLMQQKGLTKCAKLSKDIDLSAHKIFGIKEKAYD